MYKFSKSAWHVKFFTWIFNVNPVDKYKTMCPYFWVYVFIFLFLPIILIFKMFGKYGTKPLNKIRTYNENNRLKKQNLLLEKIKNRTLKYGDIDLSNYYDLYDLLDNMEDKKYLSDFFYTELKSKNSKYEKKPNIFKYVAKFIVLTSLSYLVTLIVMFLIENYNKYVIDWDLVGYIIITISLVHSFVSILNFFVDKNFFNIFKFIGKGLLIIWDMVVSIYNKSCPIITWVDEEKK